MPDDKKLNEVIDAMVAAGDSDDAIRSFVKEYRAKQQPSTSINFTDELKKGVPAFGKRFAENLVGMAQMAITPPQKLAADLAQEVTGAYIRGDKATEQLKKLSPIQPGEGSIGEKVGRSAADIGTMLIPMGPKLKTKVRLSGPANTVTKAGGGFGRTLMEAPSKALTPEAIINEAQRAAGPHSIPASPQPAQKVAAFQRATGMEAPSGPIVGAPAGSRGQVSMSVPMRAAKEAPKPPPTPQGTGKGPTIRRPGQTTTEELVEQTQRGVQNDFQKGKRVTFEKPVEAPKAEVPPSTPEQKIANEFHKAEAAAEALKTPAPLREPRFGQRLAETLKDETGSVPRKTLTHPQQSSRVRGGLESIQAAYDQAKRIPRAERTVGQQKLYDEVGKLLALSKKAVGQDVPSGKVSNPNEFVEMLRRVSQSEEGGVRIAALIPLAGAVIGGAMNPNDPVKGAAIGGTAGFGLSKINKLVPGAIALRREGFLSGAAIPKNLAASVGGAVTAAAESGSTKPIKEILRAPTNAQNFLDALRNPQHKFQFAQGAPQKPSGLGKISPSNIISAIDQTTSKALERAGIPVEDIERILLTADRNPIQQMIEGATKAGSPERKTATEVGRVILPFQRTPANVITEGVGEIAHMTHNPLSKRGMITAASPLIGWAIGEWVKEDPVRRGPLGGIALAALGSRSGIATLMASTSAGRQAVGGVSPIPEMAFDINSAVGIPPTGLKFWKRILGKED